jgi:hypothetical protein
VESLKLNNMKNTIAILALMLLTVFTPILAQDNSKMVSIPVDQLTEQQRAKLSQNETIETVSSWTGLGKEVGEAVNGAVGSLTNHAVSFSETKLGRFTMFIIAYKVIGKEIIRIIIGIPMLIIIILISLVLIFKNGLNKRVVETEKIYNMGKKDEFTEKEYVTIEGDGHTIAGVTFIGAIIIALTLLFMFA